MRLFTVIIPTWNQGRYLKPLFDSIVRTPFADHVEEILFICDKSTDGSEQVIENLIRERQGKTPSVRMIQPPERKGLFVARYIGAKASKTEKILFVDSRITWPEITGQKLGELGKKYPAMSSRVDIDIKKNVFCLYWQRSHETIFGKTYKAGDEVVTVTAQNFGQYRIGGTCFYCSRDLFVRMSEQSMEKPLHSDDTLLMSRMIHHESYTIHPDFRISWEPRDQWWSFVRHLYQRGPGFVEYHFFEKRGWLFAAVLCACLFALFVLGLLFIEPLWALAAIGAGLALLALSTALIVKGPIEFIRLAPLHTAVIIAYGLGSLRGVWIILKKRRTGVLIPQK